MNNVLIISGSFPPDVCGVGDYSSNLIKNSKFFTLFYKKNWQLRHLKKYISEITKMNIESIILQYPTQGYGWSILPHLLVFYFSKIQKKNFITVLHEYSQLSFKARMALSIVLYSTKHLVVTNKFEKEIIIKKIPWLKNKIDIIKIYSNIPSSKNKKNYFDRTVDIVYFGQIRPNKGIEVFLQLAQNHEIFQFKKILLGSFPEQFTEYFQSIFKKANELNIEIMNNASDEKVAEILGNSKIAFLPFPDGCSERRGSFLAAIKNGCIVLTTEGSYTTEEIKKIAYFTEIENAKEKFLELINSISQREYDEIQKKTEDYLTNAIPTSWDDVINKYKEVIDNNTKQRQD